MGDNKKHKETKRRSQPKKSTFFPFFISNGVSCCYSRVWEEEKAVEGERLGYIEQGRGGLFASEKERNGKGGEDCLYYKIACLAGSGAVVVASLRSVDASAEEHDKKQIVTWVVIPVYSGRFEFFMIVSCGCELNVVSLLSGDGWFGGRLCSRYTLWISRRYQLN